MEKFLLIEATEKGALVSFIEGDETTLTFLVPCDTGVAVSLEPCKEDTECPGAQPMIQ